MEKLTKEVQLTAAEKVLEEMQKAEEYLKSWNAVWEEMCYDVYSPKLYYTGRNAVQKLERKYNYHYRLANVHSPESRISEPLKRVVLADDNGEEYECEFGRVDWHRICSNQSLSSISFQNNGDIEFSKRAKNPLKRKLRKKVNYHAKYNVLTNDFNVTIALRKLINQCNDKGDYISISLKEDKLIIQYNDVEIIHDLTAGINHEPYSMNTLDPTTIKELEEKAIKELKHIKWNLPLIGLVERIDNCLKQINKTQYITVSNRPKVLKRQIPSQ